MTPRPVALTVNVAGIPDALRREHRWVLWRYESRDERWTKIPCQPSGQHAKPNDPTTWCGFAEAVAAYATGRFDGIGFCLGDGWAGVDFDNVLLHHTASSPVVSVLGCYVEASPGGIGLKAIGRSARIGGEVKFDKTDQTLPIFTAWSGARFFALTGRGSGDPSVDISSVIENWFPPPVPIVTGSHAGFPSAADLSDDDLLLQAVGADNGDKFLRLWRGDLSAYGQDHSRADLALCCLLAFWTNYDANRVDRLFRQSSLYRAKWDTACYRRSTLGKAMQAACPVSTVAEEPDPVGEDIGPEDADEVEITEVDDPDDDLEEIDPNDLVDEVGL